jgi:hypothetical protein
VFALTAIIVTGVIASPSVVTVPRIVVASTVILSTVVVPLTVVTPPAVVASPIVVISSAVVIAPIIVISPAIVIVPIVVISPAVVTARLLLADVVSPESLDCAMVMFPVRPFSAMGQCAAISIARVVAPVYMATKVVAAVIPGTGSQEDSIRKPFRTIVAVGSTVVWRVIKIPIRTFRLRSDLNAETYL